MVKRKEASASSTEVRALGVILEQMQAQMEVVLEAVHGSRQSLEARMTALEARLSDRISVLEAVVRKNSEDICTLQGTVVNLQDTVATLQGTVGTLEGTVATLQGTVATLREEVAALRRDFDRRQDRRDLEALERRVSAIEGRLGIRP